MSLKDYWKKRDFTRTPEPPGATAPRFVVQMHQASRLHFDFRLEVGGVLKSWALPKGPTLDPLEQRLAVFVEDHPLEYGDFEGVIPEGNYGAGTVVVWDRGTFRERKPRKGKTTDEVMEEGIRTGKISFVLEGHKLKGEFALVNIKGDPKSWLFLKKEDAFARRGAQALDDRSVKSGRTLAEVAETARSRGEIWLPEGRPRSASSPGLPELSPEDQDHRPAEAETIPRKIKPKSPVSFPEVFHSPDWLYEPLYGGYRAIAEKEGTRVRLYSRQGLDYAARFPEVVKELRGLSGSGVWDGEIVVENAQGKPDAGLLRGYGRKKEGTPRYRIWDVLHREGKNLRYRPLKERLKVLGRERDGEHLGFSRPKQDPETVEPRDQEILARHAKGIYRSETSKAWLRLPPREAAPEEESGERPPAAKGPVVRITHPEKIYFPEDGITKGELVEYYRRVGLTMLPYLKDRPISMNRHPDGIGQPGFYHKDFTGYLPRGIATHRVASGSSGKTINYLLCQNVESLLFLANFGCIEIHPWLSRIHSLDNPDYVVIDLDPGRQEFPQVVEVAWAVRRVLQESGADALVKTSGSRGLHICVPTGGAFSFEVTLEFAKEVVRVVEKRLPALTTTERTPSRRGGKLYLDAYQNRRSQTLAAPYCVRPKDGAPVSAPVQWEELKELEGPAHFHMKNMPARLEAVGDLWKPMLSVTVNLSRCLEELAGM